MPNLSFLVVTEDQDFCDTISRLLGDAASGPLRANHPDRIPAAAVASDPRLSIVDARLHGALPLCEALSRSSGSFVMLVGGPDDDTWAEQALEAGARGILTHARQADFNKAIRVIAEGGIWARRRWIDASLKRLASFHRGPASAFDAVLSTREQEVCRYAVLGLSNKELADRLGISEATVKVHLTHIFQKLGVQGRGQLAATYYGFVPPILPALRRSARAARQGSSTGHSQATSRSRRRNIA